MSRWGAVCKVTVKLNVTVGFESSEMGFVHGVFRLKARKCFFHLKFDLSVFQLGALYLGSKFSLHIFARLIKILSLHISPK